MPDPTSWVTALVDGARRLKIAARMVFPLYVVNLAVALFALLPFYVALHRVTATRPAASRLLVSWDLEIVAELVMDHPTLLSQLQAVLLFVPLAYLLLSQILLGGALGALGRTSRPSAKVFGADAMDHFFPLLRLLLWSAVPFALTGAAIALGYSLTEGCRWPTRALALTPGLILWAWADATLDFARARRILLGERSALRNLLTGFLVVLRRPAAALGLHLGFGALGLAPLALLLVVPSSLDAGGALGVLTAFLARQLVILMRVTVRVWSLGAHLAFLQGPLEAPRTSREAAPSPTAVPTTAVVTPPEELRTS